MKRVTKLLLTASLFFFSCADEGHTVPDFTAEGVWAFFLELR